MSQRRNLTGRKFGRLTALSFTASAKNRSMWNCVCECGNRVVVLRDSLLRGRSKSCGCIRKEQCREQCRDWSKSLLDGGRPHNILPPGVGAFNRVYGAYIGSSRSRGLEWGLNREIANKLLTSSCHYCSIPPSREKAGSGLSGSFFYNGIDRVDNNIGYTPDNCVACCWLCNRAKASMPYDGFITWLDRIADARRKPMRLVRVA
jgi:hypothetical protein